MGNIIRHSNALLSDVKTVPGSFPAKDLHYRSTRNPDMTPPANTSVGGHS